MSNNLVRLSGYLFEKGLISQENDSELRNRYVEEADRAARLVELIQQKVKLDPHNYVQFTSILEEDKHHYSDILRILREAYSSLVQGKDRLVQKCSAVTRNNYCLYNAASSDSESVVQSKTKSHTSNQVSHGDTQPSDRGSFV